MRLAIIATAIFVFATLNSDASEYRVAGRVIDANGEPVRHATVSPFWRANGSPHAADGQKYDLSNKEENIVFWGNVGNMHPWQTPVETAVDGSFALTLPGRTMHLFAMDASRSLGGIAEIRSQAEAENVEIRLHPLVTVSGNLKSVVPGKRVDWSHVYVEIATDTTNPLAMRRVVSCGSYQGSFEFRLPPGSYRLDAYGNSDRALESIDLRMTSIPKLTIDGTQPNIDVGTLELEIGPPDRQRLEETAKKRGRWRNYTEHYGEPAPDWHAVDARGISRQATIKHFRGKWLMIEFWGLGCAPCLANGVPKMMDFYETHTDQKDRFEIVGVCIDIHGEYANLQAVDKALAPIVAHVWKGRNIEFPIILDNTFRTWERYGIPGLGTTVLVDPNGNLVEGDDSTLHQILERTDGQ